MHFEKIKRDQVDRCNICGKMALLTWDHVPPKSCGNGVPREYSLMLGCNDPKNTNIAFPWTSQDGIKYRSICAECNNQLLGKRLDPAYREMYDNIKKIVERDIFPYDEFAVECSVNKLARAVVGHMLAAKNFYDEKCIVDSQLRKFVLDSVSLPPNDLHLYYYPYFYQTTFVARDVVLLKATSPSEGILPDDIVSCLNSYPLAYVLTGSNDELPFPDLFQYCDTDFDSRKHILIHKHNAFYENSHILRHPQWPCGFDDELNGIGGIVSGRSAQDIVFSRKKVLCCKVKKSPT